MRKLVSFLGGAFLGGLVGATFALLFTPSTGPELQSRIRRSFNEIVDEVKTAALDKRQELTVELEKLRQG